jgi:hypothetical protein
VLDTQKICGSVTRAAGRIELVVDADSMQIAAHLLAIRLVPCAVLCALATVGDGVAAETNRPVTAPVALDLTPPVLLIAETPTFSSSQFRPRPPSLFDIKALPTDPSESPMLEGTTVWQRMRDFKAHGRVRVLTLWQTRGSSLSLQAGKRGDPSLQWTSRLNRSETTRGLLDSMFTTSLGHADQSRPYTARANAVQAPQKQTSSPSDLKQPAGYSASTVSQR